MLYTLLGILWIVIGFLWMVRPQHLRSRLQRKMTRRVRWIIFGFLLTFGCIMIGSVIRAPGLLMKVVGVVGLVITAKAILLVTSKASRKILDWWTAKPLRYFRIWGAVVFITGVLLVLGTR